MQSTMGFPSLLANFITVLFSRTFTLLHACFSFFMNTLFFRKSVPLALEAHRYTALDSKDSSFRLLKLLRHKRHELECELLPQSLSESEHDPYEALSYAEGSTELVECIILDGKRCSVTENLYSALQCMRLHDRDRFLWVDTICINQTDKEEQSQQVQQKGKIYKNAERVLIWLGKATSEMANLMAALDQFCKINPYRVPGQWPQDDSFWETHRVGLQQMLDRPWFARVWSLQEAANARKVDICCGTWSIPAEAFALAPSLIGETPGTQCQSVLDVMPESSRTDSWWAQKRDLYTLLCKFQTSKATDEHDKIYALLGMSTNPLDTQNIAIDYQRPTHEIIHEAVKYLLQPDLSSQPDTSSPVAIYEVLNLMSNFETLDTTFFVPAFTQEGATEVIFPHLQSGSVLSKPQAQEDASQSLAVPNDPTLFLFEERPKRSLKEQETCYSQVAKLMLDAQATKFSSHQLYEDGIQVVSWGGVEQHVKIVVIHDRKKAILKAALQGCYQVVKQLLSIKVGTNGDEWCDRPALLEATEQENTLAIQTLFNPNIDVDTPSKSHEKASSMASCEGNMKTLKLLLNVGIGAYQE